MNSHLEEVVKEELNRLGIDCNSKSNGENKFPLYQYGSKFVGVASNNFTKEWAKTNRNLTNFETSLTPNSKRLKQTSLSPFSRKSAFERKSCIKRLNVNEYNSSCSKVFEIELESLPLSSTVLQDGRVVEIPQFLIDINDIIRSNICIEGIFRKAGSKQRQIDYKKILNAGRVLPKFIHPVDAACLLKQFLGSLPSPLLSYHVHFLMTKCLELPEEDQREGLSLCALILPKRSQHLLAYILELLSCVSKNASENQMTSRNLAIVIAPNLFSTLTHDRDSARKRADLSGQNSILTSTIDVVERLIDGANGICRAPDKLVTAAEEREKSRSVENLNPVDSGAKGRRSGSLNSRVQGFVSGIRRIVQGTLGSLDQHSGKAQTTIQPSVVANSDSSSVSMDPDGESNLNTTPNKRKFEVVDQECKIDPLIPLVPKKTLHRSVKKLKIDSKSAAETFNARPAISTRKFFAVKLKDEDRLERTKRRYSLRDRKELIGSPSTSQVESRRRKSSVSIPCRAPSRNSSRSNLSDRRPARRVSSSKMKSSTREPAAFSSKIRTSRNTLSSRDTVTRKPSRKSPKNHVSSSNVVRQELHSLEKEYFEIKSIVESMEKEVDASNVKQLRSEIEPFLRTKNKSCSQLISDAYERTKLEAGSLDSSPAENLTRRLGKELKIRSRRSDEFRVFRSPSERKIKSIRRRSKEIDQNLAKQIRDSKSNLKLAEPKIKSGPLNSPHISLRRGRPNSLKTGLPLLIRSPAMKANWKNSPGSNSYGRNSANASPIPVSDDSYKASPLLTRSSERLKKKASNAKLDFEADSGKTDPPVDDSLKDDIENLSYVRGCTFLLSASGNDLSHNNSDWVPASKFLNDVERLSSKKSSLLNIDPPCNRPSIIALKEKKTVTSNIQLFNKSAEEHDNSSFAKFHHSDENSSTTFNLHRRYPLTPVRNIHKINAKHISPNRSFLHNRCPETPQNLFKTPRIVHSNPVSRTKRLRNNLPNNLTPLPSRLPKKFCAKNT